jgi:hypothetical protein
MRRISVFQCDTDPDLYGYTADRAGKALLRAGRELRWSYVGDNEVSPDDGHSAVDVTDMLHHLDLQGYYLFSLNPRRAPALLGGDRGLGNRFPKRLTSNKAARP